MAVLRVMFGDEVTRKDIFFRYRRDNGQILGDTNQIDAGQKKERGRG